MYIIWNLTRVCPWNCAFCCVSAVYAKGKERTQIIAEQKKKELSFAQKLGVLKMIAGKNMIIDFSGGDPLYSEDDLAIVQKAIEFLPPEKINISMTGCELTQSKIELLKKINMVEFTLDNLPDRENPFRPRGFNRASMKAMRRLVESGIKVSAVTILYNITITEENLRSIYAWLCKNGIQEWDILKYIPVGRGMDYKKIIPTDEQYLFTMKFLRSLNGSTHISFQHSLRVIEETSKCHATINSFGVLPNGEAIACAWALDRNGCTFDGFQIGKLPDESLDVILKRAREKLGFNHQTSYCRANLCAMSMQQHKERI
ncbi:MAG: radical SAM/SPASM domain-containing protein [Patescibacteria group bacterium]|nr:radical SAM/SPASM domain-containing protein [Patescibacteria group bacterium]